MHPSTECTVLGGWSDIPVKSLEQRVLKALKYYLKEHKQPGIKKIIACSSKCVRGQLIRMLYISSNGTCYQAVIHNDIDQLYVRSIEEHGSA
ncbi:Hypothetical protein GLP15_1822 [Giardia lamblia P15]|uniref:Uncharacterized protein n=1 Tax=Giardia intestinalis (strain P15) TaxID=658858 RepID=E1EYJ5_GIAIA|nr:Hypothetical protein GLP15_1822 [Giardia lamblia P15]